MKLVKSDSGSSSPEKSKNVNGIPCSAIERQLDKILASEVFAAAPRMRQLLAFLVQETLVGNPERLDQRTLGIEVFEQNPANFDPRRNPIVRVQVSKLRHELQRYYGARCDEPIRLEIPRGQYGLVFKQAIPGGSGVDAEVDPPAMKTPTAPVASRALPDKGHSLSRVSYPTLEVAPLSTLSGSVQLTYFSQGLTEDLIAALTKFSYLRVIESSVSCEPAQVVLNDSREMDRPSSPRYRLEGSVRQALGILRVAVRLVDVTSGVNRWSSVYDRPLTDANILEVQDEITTRIVTTIASSYGIILQLDMAQVGWEEKPDRLDAHDYLLWTFDYWRRLAPEEHGRLRRSLEQRVESGPDCATVWALLALLYLDEARFGLNPRSPLYDPLERAPALAQRAVALEPTNELTHQAVLNACFHTGAMAESQAAGERALALNPLNPDVMAELGACLSLAGQWDRGIPLLRRAKTLSPGLPGWKTIALFCDALRRDDYATALHEAAAIGMAGWCWSHVFLSVAHGLLGQSGLARIELKRLLALDPGFAKHGLRDYRQLGLPRDLLTKFVEGLERAGLRVPSR